MSGADSYECLGIPYGSGVEEIHKAYRNLIKQCHPDLFSDPVKRREAQEETVRLNLAYEDALRQTSHAGKGFQAISPEEAKHYARNLLKQNKLESAMWQLSRADQRDADWYALRGEIEMALRQYDAAHESYREAVRREPENKTFREGALQAALAVKKSHSLAEKLFGWIKKG